MSVSPRPAKRRDGQIQCQNCPVWFTPRAKGGSPQRFHSDACRKQWNHNGAAFGKLRDKLPGYIEQEVRKQFVHHRLMVTDVLDVIEKVNERLDLATHDQIAANEQTKYVRNLIQTIREKIDGFRV